LLKRIPSTVECIVEDYDTGEFKWCDAECPYIELPSENNAMCRLYGYLDSLQSDIRGELRCMKCYSNEDLMKGKHHA
jgi:hypothetical protein